MLGQSPLASTNFVAKPTSQSRILKMSSADKLRSANFDLKNQIAGYAAKLHRLNRFLGTLKVCNQAVLEATGELLEAIGLVAEPAGAAVKSSKELLRLRLRYNSLTPREREVMAMVVQGFLNKQIAAEIGTSETTAKVHRSQLMRKMGAESLADLVRMAEKIGIPSKAA